MIKLALVCWCVVIALGVAMHTQSDDYDEDLAIIMTLDYPQQQIALEQRE